MTTPLDPSKLQSRLATPADAAAITDIFNQGIEEHTATFETRLREVAEIEKWFDGVHPTVVVENDGEILAFASTSTYRPRDCYAGVAEYSIYVAREHRSKGAGRVALQALIDASEEAGFWKLVSRIFPENKASIGLALAVGFRVVGTYEKHGKLDGKWLDVVIVERLLDRNSV